MKYTLLESKILLFCMFRMLRLILMEYPEENKVSERGKKTPQSLTYNHCRPRGSNLRRNGKKLVSASSKESDKHP